MIGNKKLERYTYYDNGNWRLRIGDSEHRGACVDRFASYEEIGLEPEEIFMLCDMDRRAKMSNHLRLEEYQALGSVSEFRDLKKAEQKRQEGCGHWEEICSSEYLGVHYYACSICHEAALRDEIGAQVLSNLCPHCGRDLRGESYGT